MNTKSIIFLLVLSSCLLTFNCLSLSDQQATEQKQAEQIAQKREEKRNELLDRIIYKEIPIEQLTSAISSVSEDGYGFKVNAYVHKSGWVYFTIGSSMPIVGEYGRVTVPNGIRLGSQGRFGFIEGQLEIDRQYSVCIAVLKEDEYGKESTIFNGIVTRIEGLRSIQEINADREARQKAERIAKEAERLAKEEENNKFDRSRYTVISPNFRPGNYTSVDLFDLVADNVKYNGFRDQNDLLAELYKSDVVFVRKESTEIEFRTYDNITSRTFNINARSGLSQGQKVRIYYRVRLVNMFGVFSWVIDAIERL